MNPFKVFYADGSTYTGDPYEAPAMGVIVIVHKDKEHGRRISAGHDYYVWEPDIERFVNVDQIGMYCYLIRPGAKRVLLGQMVSDEKYQEIFLMSQNDPDFPPRTAYHRFEVQK